MAIAPKAPPPPLEDPVNVREIFASEVAGVAAIHGNVAITLANVRFDEPSGDSNPKAHRVVTARLILTNPAVGQLVSSLQRLATQIQAAQTSAAKKEPN